MELGATQRIILRISLLIISCTILLTASFVGFLALISGRVDGSESRIAWYIAISAILFVSTIVLLEFHGADGRTILVSATVTGVLSFALIYFSIEGVIFALIHPEDVFVSQLILYFFAAALVATGIGYWGLRHWREFTSEYPGSL